MLLLHPVLLLLQLLRETSKGGEQMEGRAKDRRSERFVLYAEPALWEGGKGMFPK